MRDKRGIYASNLPTRAVIVYFYLYDRADKLGKSFPSLKRIGRDLHISVSTVQRALNDLEKEGYIKKERRYRENGGISSNLYTIE